MSDQKVIIASLAMDLRRVALGLQRGSIGMAERFKIEALQRQQELEVLQPNSYLTKLITGSKKALSNIDSKASEDVLMYSTLFQNLAQKLLN